jgi:hypothetical protein
MDLFSACLAFGPLAIYLLLLGMINLARRPLVVSGTREMLALGLAVSGLLIIGPMQLFMPQDAAARFGAGVWILLCAFYALCLALAILLSPPRLVVYNVSFDTVRSVLSVVSQRLDHESTWSSTTLSMPQIRVHLQVESYPSMHNVSLVATSSPQSVGGWRRLELALRGALDGAPRASGTRGLWFVMAGAAILIALALLVSENPQTIARGLDRLLHP